MGRHPLRIHTPWPLAKISKARVFSKSLRRHLEFRRNNGLRIADQLIGVSYRKSLSDSTAFPCSLLDTLAGYQYLIEEKHFEHKVSYFSLFPRSLTVYGMAWLAYWQTSCISQNIILCGDLPTRLSTWLVFSWGWCQLVLWAYLLIIFLSRVANTVQFQGLYSPPHRFLRFRYSFSGRHAIFIAK